MGKKKTTRRRDPRTKRRSQTTEELAKQVSRLERKLRGLWQDPADKSGKDEGLAENVMASLGKMVPGLQNLIDIASQMPEFHERLASIDEEIKRKFEEQPVRQASGEIARGMGGRVMGIPPGVRRRRAARGRSVRAGRASSPDRHTPHGAHRKPGPPKVHISPETPQQLPVDIFDEDGHVIVLAEVHGLKREHIAVSLEENALLISVDAPERKGEQHVKLSCEVAGKPKVSLAKGFLKIELKKADKS
jgi:hypothetical protein